MYEVAAGRTPRAVFGAGGSGAVVCLYRLLFPEAGPHRVTRLVTAAGSLGGMPLPLFIACGPAMGRPDTAAGTTGPCAAAGAEASWQ